MVDLTELMIPDVTALLANDPSVPTEVMARSGGVRPLFGVVDLHSFASVAWKTHRKVWGCRWDRAGTFGGKMAITPTGARSYWYVVDADDPFYFVRHTGEMIKPGPIIFDGGSVPRPAWAIPGFDPWTYLASYLIHDWLFRDKKYSFEDANLILGECMYTQMTEPVEPFGAPEDWRVAWAVHAAVSSVFGRRAWAASP